MFRIQKILMSEFHEIYEPIIVENPFTQVSADGMQALRQYHIALTQTMVIFGCDNFDLTDMNDVGYHDVDAEIETFQLVSLLPLQCVRLQFFRLQKHEIMKISICRSFEEEPMYFEFGGHLYRNLFWNTWRDYIAKIRLMHPIFFHISGASPFSTTDELTEDELCEVEVHSEPRSYTSTCPYCHREK